MLDLDQRGSGGGGGGGGERKREEKGEKERLTEKRFGERPAALLLEVANDEGNAIVLANGILCHLSIGVAASDVPQSTDSLVNDLFTTTSTGDHTKKSLRKKKKKKEKVK